MKAIVVTCPHCGARLRTGDTVIQVVCEYCGTASRLQRRTRVLERVLPPPNAPNLPPQVAVQRRTYLLPTLLAGGMFAAVGIAVSIVAQRQAQRASTPATQQRTHQTPVAKQSPDGPRWQGTDGALLVDIDRDGKVEIVGRSRSESDRVTIIAVDLQGRLRWQSESLGTYDETYQGPLAVARDVLLFATKRGEVRAFGVGDGKPRWTAKLDERVKQFCDAGEHVIAVAADDVRRPIRLVDGTLDAPLPAERNKPACKSLAADKPDHSSWWHTREIAEKNGISGSRHKLLDAPGGRILAGTRSKGTAVPTLVALDAANKERWRVDVPTDPLGSQAREPGQVAAGDTAVCAVYHVESITKPLDATCFALADGRRLWNQRIASHYASALVVTNGLLLISTYANLEARDVETGAVRWQF